MKRLILIGNGFDLTHGLKTSYKDFITDYLRNAINIFYSKNNYVDPLIKISYTYPNMTYPVKTIGMTFENVNEEMNFINLNKHITFSFNSTFFEVLYNKIKTVNWVDVENEYFTNLTSYKSVKGFNYKEVDKLNVEFEFLKIQLEQYLIKVQNNNNRVFRQNVYSDLFCQSIIEDEIVTVKLSENIILKELYILNFNYTNTIENYFSHTSRQISTNINFIHGELEQDDNPLIFGFGDEHDKTYNEFEDYKNNTLFRHIKSFGYFKTKNYHNLIRFIDSDDFQVFIVGHSCGLSDRTMLKQIFEHEKCKSIKIFHHRREDNTNDYTEKTHQIARHFTDKGLMRKKIVPFNSKDYMP